MSARYRVTLNLEIDHISGPEPEWERVAEAAASRVEGEILTLRGMRAARARLDVVSAEVDTGVEEEVS